MDVDAGGAPPSFEETQPIKTTAATADAAAPAFEDTQDISPPAFDETQPKSIKPDDKYSSLGEEIKTGIEGVARGATSGLSDVVMNKARGLAEKYSSDPDFWVSSDQDREGRQIANPGIAGTSQFAGTMALLAALPEVSAGAALGKIGSKVLSGAILNGGIQAGNEISKAMLGQQGGDPQAAASSAMIRIGASGLLGGLFGGAGAATGEGLQALGNTKAGTKALSFLAGIAASDSSRAMTDAESAQVYNMFKGKAEFDSAAFGLGAKTVEKSLPDIAKRVSRYTTDVAAGTTAATLGGGVVGTLAAGKIVDQILGPTIERVVGKTINKAAYKYAVPAMLKAMSAGETAGLWDILDHANDVAGGAQQITKAVEAIFKGGGLQAVDSTDSERDNLRLKKFIENGGIDQAMKDEFHSSDDERLGNNLESGTSSFASGGEVRGDNHKSIKYNSTPPMIHSKTTKSPPVNNKNIVSDASGQGNPVDRLYPEQAVIMNAAKARISTYLNSVRPQAPHGLPFDDEFKDHAKEKSYNRAIELANRPLSIMNHIKSGELTPEHLAHFNAMYPELTQHLQKKLTEKVMKAQLGKEKPSYRVRQALSMFLGSDLDSTMTPQNIQAAQNVFLSQAIVKQGASQGAPKSNKASLSKMSNDYQSANESSIRRRNKV